MTRATRSSMTPKPEHRTILRMKKRLQKGGGGVWFAIILFVVGGLLTFRIGQLYFDHHTLKNEVGEIGNRSIIDRTFNAKQKIVALFSANGIFLDPEEVNVDFNLAHDRVTISFNYSQKADLVVAKPSFSFEIYEQKEQGKAAGVVKGFQQGVEGSNAAPARRYKNAIKDKFKTP